MDEEGLLPEALEQALGAGPKPAFLYTIPTFQNPSGRTLSLERRERIVELAEQHDLLVLEDDPYGLVRFEGTAQPSLLDLDDGDRVVYASSFSKTVAPGVRVGYFILPAALRAGLEATSTSTYITPGLLGEATVYEFIRSGRFDSNLDRVRGLLGARRDAMLESLDAELGGTGATWSRPEGGYFVWLDVPGHGHRRAARPLHRRGRLVRRGRRLRRRAFDRAPRLQLRLAGRDPRGCAEASRAASGCDGALAARAAVRRRAPIVRVRRTTQITDVCAEKRTKCTVTFLLFSAMNATMYAPIRTRADHREPEPRLKGLARFGVDPLATQSHGRESTRLRAALRARAGVAGSSGACGVRREGALRVGAEGRTRHVRSQGTEACPPEVAICARHLRPLGHDLPCSAARPPWTCRPRWWILGPRPFDSSPSGHENAAISWRFDLAEICL